MSKLSESDIIESIFAIIVGVLVSKGRVDTSDVNAARTLVEPFLFSSGEYEGSIAKDAKREKGSNPPDYFNVNLTVRVSEQDSEDEKYMILYRSANDIGNLREKIDRLIAQATPFKSSQISKILKARDKFLDDTDEQTITFDITANGSGDGNAIQISITAQGDEGPEEVLNERVSFNIQPEAEESKNLVTYNLLLSIADSLELKWKNLSRYDVIKKSAKSQYEKSRKFDILQMMADELFQIASQNKVDISRRAFSFLRDTIFDGLGIVVRSAPDEEDFTTFEKTARLNITQSAETLLFKETKTNSTVFTLKSNPKKTTGKIEFVLETNTAYFNKMKK